MEIKTVKISDIKPNPQNPRIIKDDKFNKLVQSLKDFPEMTEAREIVVNKEMVILGGNMRWRAMQEAGWTEVPVKVVDWTEDKQREFIVKDNASFGEWDWEELANQFEGSELKGWGLDLPADFSLADVVEDDPPELDEDKAQSVVGEVYQLGRHRLLCGDATSLDSFQSLLGGGKSNMVFTDPPYNIDYSGGLRADGSQSKRAKIANDKMTSSDFLDFLNSICENMAKVNLGAFYICMSTSELHQLRKAFENTGSHWQAYIIWAKDNFTLSRSDYQNQHEPIMYGLSREMAEAVDEKIETADCDIILYGWSQHEWYGGRKQGNVWFYDRPRKSKEHPTMKPIKLCARAIVNSSKENEIVLDPFLGSGSTLIAAEQTNRICVGMELSRHYCDVIRKRYYKFVNNGDETGWEEGTSVVTGELEVGYAVS